MDQIGPHMHCGQVRRTGASAVTHSEKCCRGMLLCRSWLAQLAQPSWQLGPPLSKPDILLITDLSPEAIIHAETATSKVTFTIEWHETYDKPRTLTAVAWRWRCVQSGCHAWGHTPLRGGALSSKISSAPNSASPPPRG
jgi:hypothetical protein